MTVDYLLFVPALVLLLMPRSWMRVGGSLWKSRRRHRGVSRGLDSLNGSTLAVKREFAKARNYFDFFRAAISSAAIVGAFGFDPVIDVAPGAAHGARNLLLVQLAVLFGGVLLQTVRWERGRIGLAAPVFYLAGMTIALQTPIPGVCAFALAWMLTPIVPNAQGFLTLASMAFVGVAIPLGGITLFTIVGAALLFLPVLLSLLARRPLVVFSRRAGTSGRTVPA